MQPEFADSAFKQYSNNLCSAIAAFGRRISTTLVDPAGLEAFTSCRLIALDKSPGVRPIGIGEITRRMIGKAILSIVGVDIQSACGPLQLCAGQTSGCEAAVHAMKNILEEDETDAVLLVDASNAFNSLNRRATLHNIQWLCPSRTTTLINIYRADSNLFVGGEMISSREGITQGDPLAMAIYCLAIIPLLEKVSTEPTRQVWYADDPTAGGKLKG